MSPSATYCAPELSCEKLLVWRLRQAMDTSDLHLDTQCKPNNGQDCRVHENLRSRICNIIASIQSRGYHGWTVPCQEVSAYNLPGCVDHEQNSPLPARGDVHSFWNKGDSVLVTYRSGLHVWHENHAPDLPNPCVTASATEKKMSLAAPRVEERVLYASEMRRAIDQHDTLRYDAIWRAGPEMKDGVYYRRTRPTFRTMDTLHSSVYKTLQSSITPDDHSAKDMADLLLSWKGGANGRSRPATSVNQDRLCEMFDASTSDAFERSVVDHGHMYTALLLPMVAEPCCVALLTVFGFTSITDDHHEHTSIGDRGPPRKVFDTFQKWRGRGGWNAIDAVIDATQCNELLRELQLYHGQLSYRPTTVLDWYNFTLLRASMLTIHPIVELAATIGNVPVTPYHYELAQFASVISHDLLDLRYDVSKGISLNSIQTLRGAVPNGGCHECVAECLVLMSVHLLLAEGTSECTYLAALIAGCGVPRSYAFGMYRDLLNARGTQLEGRCANAWQDAANVLQACLPEIRTDQLRCSSAEEAISNITELTEGFRCVASFGDSLIKETTETAACDTSTAEAVDALWQRCIERFAQAFIEYLNCAPQQLTGLMWSAFIHGSQMRISMGAGSIRHATNRAGEIPDWNAVLNHHTESW